MRTAEDAAELPVVALLDDAAWYDPRDPSFGDPSSPPEWLLAGPLADLALRPRARAALEAEFDIRRPNPTALSAARAALACGEVRAVDGTITLHPLLGGLLLEIGIIAV